MTGITGKWTLSERDMTFQQAVSCVFLKRKVLRMMSKICLWRVLQQCHGCAVHKYLNQVLAVLQYM